MHYYEQFDQQPHPVDPVDQAKHRQRRFSPWRGLGLTALAFASLAPSVSPASAQEEGPLIPEDSTPSEQERPSIEEDLFEVGSSTEVRVNPDGTWTISGFDPETGEEVSKTVVVDQEADDGLGDLGDGIQFFIYLDSGHEPTPDRPIVGFINSGPEQGPRSGLSVDGKPFTFRGGDFHLIRSNEPNQILTNRDGTGYTVVTTAGATGEYGTPYTPEPYSFGLDGTITASGLVPGGILHFTEQGKRIFCGRVDQQPERLGDLSGLPLNGGIIDMAMTSSGEGYYLIGSDGGVFSFGDAEFHGSTGDIALNEQVVAIVPTEGGYHLIAADGGVFSFGDAEFHGSIPSVLPPGVELSSPIIGAAPVVNKDGRTIGYNLFAADGGVFSFGSGVDFNGSLVEAIEIIGFKESGEVFGAGSSEVLSGRPIAGRFTKLVDVAMIGNDGAYLIIDNLHRVFLFGGENASIADYKWGNTFRPDATGRAGAVACVD